MPERTRAVISTRTGGVHAALGALMLVVTASAVAAAVPVKRPAHAPSPTPAPTPSGPPVIFSVSALPRIAHAGDAVRWDAHVSQDVVAVTARVAVYSFSLYPVRYGHFGETFSIPKDVPPFFHGTYGVTITATNALGQATSRSISLRFE